MKHLLTFALFLCSLSLFGASPTFQQVTNIVEGKTNFANVSIGIITLSNALPNTVLSNDVRTASIGFTASGNGSALATGKINGFVVCPYAATISGWSIVSDTGTATVKCWKIASGTAKPTVANVINTSGVSLASGTAVISSTVTDFTTTIVAANDIFAFDLSAVSAATELTFQLKLIK